MGEAVGWHSAREILAGFSRDHRTLRKRLGELEVALEQARGGGYSQVQRALSELRYLCRLLQKENQFHFRQEESLFYQAVESRLSALRGLVGGLRAELGLFRQRLEDFRTELIYFNATGQLRQLPRLGEELLGILRQHIDRQERELFPVLLREFKLQDWQELQQILSRS
jgi:hemerythrin-like domain-containing protein